MATALLNTRPGTQKISDKPESLNHGLRLNETPLPKVFIQPGALQSSQYDASSNIRWLTVSPYLEAEHFLDVESLDTANRLFAQALTELEPATPEYATVKYEEALDWNSLMFALKSLAAREGHKWTQQEFYVVVFRSKLKENIDADLLFKLDKESHAEATASGGLLKYWYGVPDVNRRNLATCLWRSKEDAVNGGRGPWHKQARAITTVMYEEIDVKGLRLVIEEDVASWSFEPHH